MDKDALKNKAKGGGGDGAKKSGLDVVHQKEGKTTNDAGTVPKSGLAGLAQDVEVPQDSQPGRTTVTSIVLMGEKDSSKSCSAANIPVPEGTKRRIATFDETTEESLKKYYGEEWFDEEVDQCKNFVLPDRERDYPGFDEAEPWTAGKVLGAFFKWLKEIEEEGDTGLLVIDHFQTLYEDVAKYFAYHQNGADPLDAKLKYQEWNPRTNAMRQLNRKIRRAVVRGGTVVITGYAPRVEETLKGTKGNMKVVRELQMPTWLKDENKRDWLVQILLRKFSSRDIDDAGEAHTKEETFLAEVLGSKLDRFPQGKVVDITGTDKEDPRGLEVFWSDENLDDLEVEDIERTDFEAELEDD